MATDRSSRPCDWPGCTERAEPRPKLCRPHMRELLDAIDRMDPLCPVWRAMHQAKDEELQRT